MSLLFLTGCSAVRGAAHEAPEIRQIGSKVLHAGEEAAQEYKKYGTLVRSGWNLSADGTVLSKSTSKGLDTYTLEATIAPGSLSDGKLTEDEKKQIKCAFKIGYQTPPAVTEFAEGSTVFQRGVTNEWIGTVYQNEIAKEHKLPDNACDVVLKALPGV